MLPRSILQYFRPALSYHLPLRPSFYIFLGGRLKQVWLYVAKTKGLFSCLFPVQLIYTHDAAHWSVCFCCSMKCRTSNKRFKAPPLILSTRLSKYQTSAPARIWKRQGVEYKKRAFSVCSDMLKGHFSRCFATVTVTVKNMFKIKFGIYTPIPKKKNCYFLGFCPIFKIF